MNKYQLLYIIDNGLVDEEKNNVVDKFSTLIESLGGTVEAIDKWGTKKLAYEIDGKTEGYYVLVKFTAFTAGFWFVSVFRKIHKITKTKSIIYKINCKKIAIIAVAPKMIAHIFMRSFVFLSISETSSSAFTSISIVSVLVPSHTVQVYVFVPVASYVGSIVTTPASYVQSPFSLSPQAHSR